jgi:hypothetical protein
MTDTFSSGAHSGFGHPSDPVPPAADPPQPPETSESEPGEVSSTLTQLENKLRELEQELSSIETEPSPMPVDPQPSTPALDEQPDPPAQFAFHAPASEPSDPLFTPAAEEDFSAKLIDERLDVSVPAAIPGDAPQSLPASEPEPDEETLDPFSPPQFEDLVVDVSSPNEDPQEIAASEPETTLDPPSPPQSESLADSTLAELLSFRDRLERLTAELAEDYNQMLAKLTQQPPPAHQPELSVSPQELEDDLAQPDPPEPAQVVDAELTAPDLPELSRPLPEQPQEHSAPPTDNAPSAETDSPTEDQPQFEGHVELGVGPFYDIGSLSAFENRVASLPNVLETSVRRFEASHAVLDVRLSGPVALVRELHNVIDSDIMIRQLSENRLAITFEEA